MTSSDPTGQIYSIFNQSRFLRDTNVVSYKVNNKLITLKRLKNKCNVTTKKSLQYNRCENNMQAWDGQKPYRTNDDYEYQ